MTGTNCDKKYKSEILISHIDPAMDENHELTLEDVTPKLTKWWFQYPHLLKLNIYLGCAVFGMITVGYDGSMMSNLQTLPSWEGYFNHPSGGILGTLSNGTTIGSLCVTPFIVLVGDRIGRRHMLMIGIILTIIGAAIQAGAVNFGMFLASRIIIGLGSGATGIASAPILAECAFPSQRPAMTSMLQASFPTGAFLAALFTWGPYMSDMKYNNWSWRLPSLLQAVFPIIQLILTFLCPESPRWLIAHGKEDQAYEVLTKYHAGGDRDSRLVKFEMAEIKAAIAKELIGKKFSWGVWFSSKAFLHRLFLTFAMATILQMCGSSLLSYYFSIVLEAIGYTEPVQKLKINIGLTVYGGVWGIVFATYAGRMKRRLLIISGLLLMCATFIVWIVLASINERTNFENKSLGRGIVAIIYLFYGFYHAISPIGFTYMTEVVPYTMRSKASLIYSLTSQGWVLYNNYVNNIAMDAISWKYYIVFCVWVFIQACVVYFFFPETQGLGLEEVAQIFGEDITDIKMAGDNAVLNNEVNTVYKDSPRMSLTEKKNSSV